MLDLRALLKEASEKDASDIHLSVGVPPAFRIHGELTYSAFHEMTPGDTLEVLLNLMNPEQRELFEKNKEIDISVSVPESGRLRVSAYKQRGHITVTMRLVDPEIPDVSSLNVPEEVLKLCDESKGLILVTGPSGSGKSTVLASLIDSINEKRSLNIITLENPIEYIFTNKKSIVNQREIGIDTIDFPSALSSALRQDPDVLGIGGIESEGEADLTLKAAETGRLVFSSLYTLGAVQSVEFMIGMFSDEKRKQAAARLSNVLLATVSRQLVRTKEGTLVPAYEVLLADNAVREMIRESRMADLRTYMEANPEKGLITMDGSILKLRNEGVIDDAEAIKASSDKEVMGEMLLSSPS